MFKIEQRRIVLRMCIFPVITRPGGITLSSGARHAVVAVGGVGDSLHPASMLARVAAGSALEQCCLSIQIRFSGRRQGNLVPAQKVLRFNAGQPKHFGNLEEG
jgi:hypothetical protein